MTHTHFIGIGGTGLSAIARVLVGRGEEVSGSDRARSPLAERLEAEGVPVYYGHAPEHVQGADLVVRSSAVPDDNVEVLAAQDAGIPVLKRVDLFGDLLAGQLTIGVAGSHGKTTTTAMIVWMLHELGLTPGFIVGGEVANLGTNARAGEGETFVIEADEYDYMFWGLTPTVAVVTNVEHDHPDCFPTPESFTEAFRGFVDRIVPGGSLVACLDDPGSAALLEYAEGKGVHWLSYSIQNSGANYSADGLEPVPGAGYRFTAYCSERKIADVELALPGEHNALNALAALAAADLLNLDLGKAAAALARFAGAGRRFEVLGEAAGVVVVDDYGHHPTEIEATLAAARGRYPGRRLWAVWQPHTYSRVRQLLAEFGAAFGDAHRVVVTGVYAAREARPEDFSEADILAAVHHPQVSGVEDLGDVAAFLLENVRSGDVVIVFSAGDATQVSAALLAGLRGQEVAA